MSLGAGSVGLFCACVVWEERTEMQQEKGFIWLTVPEGSSPSWSGGCGSNQQGVSGRSRRLAGHRYFHTEGTVNGKRAEL